MVRPLIRATILPVPPVAVLAVCAAAHQAQWGTPAYTSSPLVGLVLVATLVAGGALTAQLLRLAWSIVRGPRSRLWIGVVAWVLAVAGFAAAVWLDRATIVYLT